MKNKKSIIYINSLAILFILLSLLLWSIGSSYFILLFVALSFLSIIFLGASIFMIWSEHCQDEEPPAVEQYIKQESTKEEHKNPFLSILNDKSWTETTDLFDVVNQKLIKLSEQLQLVAGVIYKKQTDKLVLESTYVVTDSEIKAEIKIGEGLTGEVARTGRFVEIDNAEELDWDILSGLGQSTPNYLYILPILQSQKIIGVVEIATFIKIEKRDIQFLIDILKYEA